MEEAANFDETIIEKRRQKLARAGKELKNYFIGLDDIVDNIIANIEAWYVTPQLLTRPTIVCLWGLTGNGKTDLVRRLVDLLEKQDEFVEIQLTNKGSSQNTYYSTLQALLATSNIQPETEGVLLLDEVQRFRSIDNEGKDIQDYQFQDLWMLLSDGNFGASAYRKQSIIDLICETLYTDDYEKTKEKEDDDKKKAKVERRFKQSYWSARQIKRLLRLEESQEEIMQWSNDKKLDVLTNALEDKSNYRPETYSKLLIFISGNLDEAYTMADQTDEVDYDADVFHKHSLGINLLNIKESLKTRFKPEQIARFGNTHILYPSLSKTTYEEIIKRKCSEVTATVKKLSGVKIKVDQSVYDVIYRNGVFPAQGTRPVFSTISSLFESSLPKFTLESLKQKVKEITLYYKEDHLVAKVGTRIVKVKNTGSIDNIKKKKKSKNKLAKVAVHEAGHAIVYTLCFGVTPTQINSNAASNNKNGFIGIHNIDESKDNLLKKIITLMAGRAAEEIVFGTDNIGSGAWGDIEQATREISYMVRLYGMNGKLSRHSNEYNTNAVSSNLNIHDTNESIETIIKESKQKAVDLLKDHLPLLRDLSKYLISNSKCEHEDYYEICKKHGVKTEYLDVESTYYCRYDKLFNEFFKDMKDEQA